MNLPIFLAIGVALFFGSIAIIFSVREEKYKKLLEEKEETHTPEQKLSYLKHFPQTIHNTLKEIEIHHDTKSQPHEKIFKAITNTLHTLFPSSHIASLNMHSNMLFFTFLAYGPVGHIYVDKLKKSMRISLEAIGTPIVLPPNTEDVFQGIPLAEGVAMLPNSFFHIPLISDDKILGIITVSSPIPHAYTEDEVTTAYRMSHHASSALLSINDVIEKERNKLAVVINNLDEGICMLDPKKNLIFINNAAKVFLGISSEKPTLTEILQISPKLSDLDEQIDTLLQENTPIQPKEIALAHGSFLLSVIPLTKTATLSGVLLTLKDITSDKTYWQMREDFTHMIIHEMRAPLTAIKAGISLLKDPTGITADEQKKMSTVISQQTEKLLAEIASLLDTAKIEKGPFVISKAQGNIQTILKKAVELFTPETQEKHISLTANIDPTIPTSFFDPMALEKVINNLVSNSIKFTASGGSIRIEAKFDTTSHMITIKVIDTGSGVAKEKQELLFHRFSQAGITDETRDNQIPGSGLGLYITKGIVEAHGGTINLESEVNKGTTVTVNLPAN